MSTELCQLRWLPGHELTHVWAYDPEPLLIRGGGGVIVCEWQEVRRPKGRSGERLVILRKTSGGMLVVGERGYNGNTLREVVAEAVDEEVIFRSNVDLTAVCLRERIGLCGAVRMIDGGRVGRERDTVEFSDGPGRPANDRVGSWHVMTGSKENVRYAIDGFRDGVPFGEVAIRYAGEGGLWDKVLPGLSNDYLLKLKDDVEFLPFEQIVKGV